MDSDTDSHHQVPESLLNAPKYRAIYPGAVERVYRDQLRRHGPKEAEKAARTELHRISGAFLTPKELKKARALMEAAREGQPGTVREALALHASTRERLPEIGALYERALSALGRPALVADLACGLNPLYLGDIGLRVRGVDLNVDAARLVNDWAAAMGWDVCVEPGDLMSRAPLPGADATLVMKLLPLLDGQQKGGGAALLERIRSPYALVTFPLRTLSGRNVGMRASYEKLLMGCLPRGASVTDSFVFSGELCFTLKMNR